MSTIEKHLHTLRSRHYVRNATAPNHWFDFTANKVARFVKRYGDDFCLVINGSHTYDDAYVIPFVVARQTFIQSALDDRGRWVGTIVGSQLILVPSHNSLRVASNHNAFHYLGL